MLFIAFWLFHYFCCCCCSLLVDFALFPYNLLIFSSLYLNCCIWAQGPSKQPRYLREVVVRFALHSTLPRPHLWDSSGYVVIVTVLFFIVFSMDSSLLYSCNCFTYLIFEIRYLRQGSIRNNLSPSQGRWACKAMYTPPPPDPLVGLHWICCCLLGGLYFLFFLSDLE